MSKVTLSWALLLQLLLLAIIVTVGAQFLAGNKQAIKHARWVSILFLSYGLFIALSIVYREENVIGSFSGYLYVMICLPLLINLSDYLKKKGEIGEDHIESEKS